MPDTDSEGYYVSVMDHAHSGGPAPAGTRTGLLLGPYPAKADAEHDVPVGRRLAQQVNDRAVWYAYGVTRVAVRDGGRLPPGRLNELAFQDGACLLIKDASLPVPRSVIWPPARPAPGTPAPVRPEVPRESREEEPEMTDGYTPPPGATQVLEGKQPSRGRIRRAAGSSAGIAPARRGVSVRERRARLFPAEP